MSSGSTFIPEIIADLIIDKGKDFFGYYEKYFITRKVMDRMLQM